MGKFCQHLIKAKHTAAFCQQEPFPCHQLLAESYVGDCSGANEYMGEAMSFVFLVQNFDFRPLPKALLPQTGL